MESFIKSISKSFIGISLSFTLFSCNSVNPNINSNLMFSINSYDSSFLFVPNETANFVYTPPDYVDLENINEKNISFGDDDYKLTGTLTIPNTVNTRRKIPAVVLVHGSGPNDRDESYLAYRPFRDIAMGLASQGIAVFRYDKRTRVYPGKMSSISGGFTPKEEVTDDVNQAINTLKNTANINTNKIFVIGHDLGGMLAPKIAQENSSVHGIAILAGNSQPLEDVMFSQIQNSVTSNNLDKNDFSIRVNNVKELMKNPNNTSLQLPYNIPAKYWNYLNKYNQTETAKKLNLPILIMQGEMDTQVDMNNFYLWQKDLENKDNVTFKSYTNLNHLFFEGEMNDKNQVPKYVSDEVIYDLGIWIKSN